jgi:plasmid stabilization system protein ParE
MSFEVQFAPEAEDDLGRLFDFLLARARTLEDLALAAAAIEAIRASVQHQLAVTPYSFRKAGPSPTRRELVVPFGATGYVALYEIADATTVVVLAVRHQREEDYH